MATDPTSLSQRQMNRLRVIEMLYRQPGSSRTDLARWTGLSRATVSTLVEELGRAGVVEEREAQTPTARGPPGARRSCSRSSPAPPSRSGSTSATSTSASPSATSPASSSPTTGRPPRSTTPPIESLDLADELVRASLRGAGIAPDRLLGVGMGLAAPINRATGEIAADGILPGWHGIRPAAEMQARLGVPVELENDANVGALGEKVFGAARGVDDLIYVRVSAGIGAGLILGGRPYRGFRGVAGEIGHVLADPDGPICRCGNRGCLETVASPVAVAALLERSTGTPVSVAAPARARRRRRPRRPARGGRRRRGDRPRALDARQRPQPGARRRRRRPGPGRARSSSTRSGRRSSATAWRPRRARCASRPGRWATAPRSSARPA